MAKKNQLTTCSPIPWTTVQNVINQLTNEGNYKFVMLVAIGCFAGLRIKDILRLKWSDLLDKDVLEIRESKTGKVRRITLNLSLKNIVKDCHAQSDIQSNDNPIFINRSGSKNISVQYINRVLHKIFAKHNIKGRNNSSHCLRKSFARRCWEKTGCSDQGLILVSEMLAHSNTALTRRYIGLEDAQFENMYLTL